MVMPEPIVFDIADDKTVSDNLAAYRVALNQLDPVLGPILGGVLLSLLETPECEKVATLDALKTELDATNVDVDGNQGAAQ
jgi:hypothetical protein